MKERTFIIIKPDAVQRTLIGEVIQRFERSGLKLSALKFIVPTENLIEKHYTIDPDWVKNVGQKSIDGYLKKSLIPPTLDPLKLGQKVLSRMVKYMTSGPVMSSMTSTAEGSSA